MFVLKGKTPSRVLIAIFLSIILTGLAQKDVSAGGGRDVPTYSKKFIIEMSLRRDFQKEPIPEGWWAPWFPLWDEVTVKKCKVYWVRRPYDLNTKLETLYGLQPGKAIWARDFYPSVKLNNCPQLFGPRLLSYTGNFTIEEFPNEGYPVMLEITIKWQAKINEQYGNRGAWREKVLREYQRTISSEITSGNVFSFSWP